MKPSFIDEIFSTPKETKPRDIVVADLQNTHMWSRPIPINYLTLKKLIPKNLHRKGFAERILDNIYYYNSKVEIIKYDDEQFLIILRDAEVIIDLFNYTREMFVGKENTDENINSILKDVGCESFVFLSLKEAEMANDIFRQTDKDVIIKKGLYLMEVLCWGEICGNLLC